MECFMHMFILARGQQEKWALTGRNVESNREAAGTKSCVQRRWYSLKVKDVKAVALELTVDTDP